jgi:hypothetical protein
MWERAKAVGVLEFGDLPTSWRKLDAVFEMAHRVSSARDARLFDGRAVDESRLGGHRLYPLVERYLNAAQDCHEALPKLLQAHGATQTAMWCLLRGQFEASFYALWLLSPRESKTRVLRAIRLEWLDDDAARRHAREVLCDGLTPIDDGIRHAELERQNQLDREHTAIYRGESEALGSKVSRPPSVNIIDELNGLESDAMPAQRVLLRHTWRTLAGLQHGNTGALLRVSSTRNEGHSVGSVILHLEPDDSAFQTLASTTAWLTVSALLGYMDKHQPHNGRAVYDLVEVRRVREEWSRL